LLFGCFDAVVVVVVAAVATIVPIELAELVLRERQEPAATESLFPVAVAMIVPVELAELVLRERQEPAAIESLFSSTTLENMILAGIRIGIGIFDFCRVSGVQRCHTISRP
jgi:hypothetical protein